MRAALALTVLCAAALGASPPQVFRSSAEAVRVDVLVTDRNRPVTGLTAADFNLRDSGVQQQVDSVALEDVPLSVMLALDTSDSLRGTPIEHLRQAAVAVVELLREGDRAALLTFSAPVGLPVPWTPDRASLVRAIAAVTPSGGTSLHDAAFMALTLRDGAGGRPLVLVFSDGDDTISWLPGDAIIQAAHRSEAVVYAVGLRTTDVPLAGYRIDFSSGPQPPISRVAGRSIHEGILPALAEETGGAYIEAERSDRLRETFVRIVNEFRTRYVLTYRPTGVERGGWHPIEVRLRGKRGQVTARRGYLR